MKFDELLDTVIDHSITHERRAVSVAEELTDEQFNEPAGREWSVARVFKHLCLADEPYLNAIEAALQLAKIGSGEVRYSFVGKWLAKLSGPDGNAPAPSFLIPPALALSKEVIEEWKGHKARLRQLATSAKGKDLSLRVRNPFIRFLPMNLADPFAIMDVHTERHVRQIEERSRLAKNGN